MDMDMSMAACGWPNPPVPCLDFAFLFLLFELVLGKIFRDCGATSVSKVHKL